MMFNLFDDVVIEIVSSDMFSNKSYHSLSLIKGSHVSLPHEPCHMAHVTYPINGTVSRVTVIVCSSFNEISLPNTVKQTSN